MEELIRELAQQRGALIQRTTKARVAKQALMDSPLGAALIQAETAKGDAEVAVSLLEDCVREAALETYRAQGEKKPHPAVTVKMFTRYSYAVAAAQEWCKHNLVAALKLDTKMFEKVIAAMGNSAPPFVSVQEDPRPQIASDLSKWLEE